MYEYEMAQQRMAHFEEEARRVRLADEVARGSGSHRRSRWRRRREQRRAPAVTATAQSAHPGVEIPEQRRPVELAGRRS
jgi:hypothetical protein